MNPRLARRSLKLPFRNTDHCRGRVERAHIYTTAPQCNGVLSGATIEFKHVIAILEPAIDLRCNLFALRFANGRGCKDAVVSSRDGVEWLRVRTNRHIGQRGGRGHAAPSDFCAAPYRLMRSLAMRAFNESASVRVAGLFPVSS